MKRLIQKFMVAGLTFVVGVSLSLSWIGHGRVLPYCELAANGERHHGRTVRVRARLDGVSPTIYTVYQMECDRVEALASLVEVTEAEAADPQVQELWGRLSAPKDEGVVREAEVVLSGRFDAHFSTGCWGPKFKISGADIERVLTVSETRRPTSPADEAPLRLRH